MEQRLDYPKLAPEAVRAMYALEGYLAKSGLEPSLRELVKIRASQINGCAYCIDRISRANGRIDGLLTVTRKRFTSRVKLTNE